MEGVVFGALAIVSFVRKGLRARHVEARRDTATAAAVVEGADNQDVVNTAERQYSIEEIIHIAGQLAQHVRTTHVFSGGGVGAAATTAAPEDGSGVVLAKADASPVTVADLAVQVLVTTMLKQHLGVDSLPLVGEEDASMFADGANADTLQMVVSLLERFLPPSSVAALGGEPVSGEFILRTLSEARRPDDEASGAPFWTLDPIDGTKGFIRPNGQYAIGLALVEGGRCVLRLRASPVCGSLFVMRA